MKVKSNIWKKMKVKTKMEHINNNNKSNKNNNNNNNKNNNIEEDVILMSKNLVRMSLNNG